MFVTVVLAKETIPCAKLGSQTKVSDVFAVRVTQENTAMKVIILHHGRKVQN